VKNHCWYNASINLPKLEAKYGCKMKVVVGSASFIFENGDLSVCGIKFSHRHTIAEREIRKNPNITNDEIWVIIKKEMLKGSLPNLTMRELIGDERNSHGWVEDEYGNVWDYVFDEGKTIKAGFINGVHRSKLAEMGYVLKAFNEESQKFVLETLYASTLRNVEKLKIMPREFVPSDKHVYINHYKALKQVLGY